MNTLFLKENFGSAGAGSPTSVPNPALLIQSEGGPFTLQGSNAPHLPSSWSDIATSNDFIPVDVTTSFAWVRAVASGPGVVYISSAAAPSAGSGGGGGGGAATVADGADVTQGAKGQAAATNDTGSWSVVQLIKRGLGNWTTLLDRVPAIGRKTASGSIPVVMPSDIATDLVTDSAGTLFSPGSAPHAYTYSGGLIATESVTVGGVTRVKTYTWASGNLTNETAWVAQ